MKYELCLFVKCMHSGRCSADCGQQKHYTQAMCSERGGRWHMFSSATNRRVFQGLQKRMLLLVQSS